MKLSPIHAWIANTLAIVAFLIPINHDVEIIENSGHAEIHAAIYLFLFCLFKKVGFSQGKLLLALIAQGIIIEIIQPYFGRGFAYGDILGNSIGVILGFGFFYLRELRSKRSTGPSK